MESAVVHQESRGPGAEHQSVPGTVARAADLIKAGGGLEAAVALAAVVQTYERGVFGYGWLVGEEVRREKTQRWCQMRS